VLHLTACSVHTEQCSFNLGKPMWGLHGNQEQNWTGSQLDSPRQTPVGPTWLCC